MLNLDFSSAITDTVEDKDLEGTGFTSIQTNKNSDQYNPTRINLDTTAGTLALTATQGSSAGATNTLKNALQVGINATQTFTVSTRLKGSPTNLTTSSQQGGLFFGSNQDNYVKLVVVNGGTSGLKIQLYKEEKGVGSPVDVVTGLDWAKINTLDLFLTGSSVTNSITAAYRLNSDRGARLTFSKSFKPTTSFFTDATSARAGILAFTGNAPDVPVTFDSFGIAQDAKINFQPSGSALPAGYIKDSGEAYNATRGYGWVAQSSLSSMTHTPLSIAAYARDRNRANVDQRLDTVLHMQYPNTSAAAWEYAVPNGTYSVTVSVGDAPTSSSVYNSKHSIRVEGVTAIDRFQGTAKQEYQLATVKVNVIDGRLTVDVPLGGNNTKINYIDIVNITPGKHPTATGTSIASDSTGVYLDAAVNVDVSLIGSGIGVDPATLNTTSVQLYRTQDNAPIPGLINTSGGNDAIVYQPSKNLAPNTNYTFKITTGVRDESGATFIPYSKTFNTGTNISTSPSTVNFTKSTVYGADGTGDPISSLTISPDGNNVYAATLDGKLHRWNIADKSGNLTDLETFAPSQLAGRAIIGLTFNSDKPNELWISHNGPLYPQPAADFTGKISKLKLDPLTTAFDAAVQDYVVGLPRSAKDHLSNSLAFGPDGKLYMTQGSNSAMGAPDNAWANRPERLLSAAVLQIDTRQTAPSGGFNVQTGNYGNTTGNYNPYAANAPVKIFATGTRNAYDLVWHSNGSLYVPTNGSAAGGNTPDDPATTVNEGLTSVGTQNDYLFKVIEGGYYGHPNPLRQEYIMNGGNPTNGVDPAEVVKQVTSTGRVYAGYAAGTQPDSNYRGFAYDFGRNRSPNGIIEYKSGTFGGALKNKMLVVEYSGGNDILALETDVNGDIPRGKVTQVISGLSDPLDLIEDTKKNIGNLYVAELINEGAAGRLSLLRA
jgi:hypothetical protein